jgi:hypothetical protein
VATTEACTEILDRIVTLELRERGFRDPELLRRRQAQLRVRYESELRHCVGKPLAPEALLCLRRAESIRVLAHECLK